MPVTVPFRGVQLIDCGSTYLAGCRSFTLFSQIVGQAFMIDVALPPMPVPSGRPLPVVFVLDGDHAFATVAQTARSLQMDRAGLPPVMVVGVGYRPPTADGPRPPLGLRTRDLTPSRDARYVAMMRAAPAPFTLPDDIEPGGAANFFGFIEEELTPLLASLFPIDPEDRTLLGMSLGGLFALHVLFTTPRAFRRYVALSPALWWDGRMIFTEEAALARRAGDLPARLFLSAGGREEEMEPSARMQSNLGELASTLQARRYPSLRLDHHVFEGESHLSVFPAAASRGLRSVFDRNAEAAAWATLDEAG